MISPKEIPRAAIYRAFKLARVSLEKREFPFICHALKAQDSKAAEAAQEIVMRRLDGTYSYGYWLHREHPEIHRTRYRTSETAPIEARLFWLDALIEEFSHD